MRFLSLHSKSILRGLLTVLGCLMFTMAPSPAARADATTINFDISPQPPIGSIGTMTLTLNSGGTITANVTSAYDNISGLGWNDPGLVIESSTLSGLPPGSFQTNWFTSYGTFSDGLISTTSLTSFSFTISEAGGFSSVYQLANFGGTSATPAEFFLDTSTPYAAGGDAPLSPTPEPASVALFGTGLLGIIVVMRKRPFAYEEQS